MKDCEFDKMGDDEAVKLVTTLRTDSEKLQSSIIQKDIDLVKLVSTVRSLELATKEVEFLKNNTLHSHTHTIGADTISNDRRRNFKKQTKNDRNL